jgi:ABC-type molybdate transport system ATPase subunit
LAFCDGQIDVSRHDGRVGARVRGKIHARDVGLALQAQIKAVALLA